MSRCPIVPTYTTAMLQTTRLPQPLGHIRDSKADVRRWAARVKLCRILAGGTRDLDGVHGRRVAAIAPHMSGLISWRCPSTGYSVSRSSGFRARARHGLPRAHVVHRANCHFRRASIPDNRNFIIFSFHRLLSAEVPCVSCVLRICMCLLPTLVGACDSIQRLGKMVGLYTNAARVPRNYSARKIHSGAEMNNSGASCRDLGNLFWCEIISILRILVAHSKDCNTCKNTFTKYWIITQKMWIITKCCNMKRVDTYFSCCANNVLDKYHGTYR